jgi:hypothetical protein
MRTSPFVGALIGIGLLCLAANTASAGTIVSDFNADGLPDTATVVHTPTPLIRLTLSGGSAPVLLRIAERTEVLVAADVDHDGRMDLAGRYPGRGIFVLKNGGSRFAHSFKPVDIRPAARIECCRTQIKVRGLTSEVAFEELTRDQMPSGFLHRCESFASPPSPRQLSSRQVVVPDSHRWSPLAARAPPAPPSFRSC